MSPLIASTIPSELSFTPHVVTSFAHELDKEPCFADAGLVDLFDSYPRASIEIMTMGSRLEDAVWRRGDPGDLSGSEILRAIAHGHLWVNIKHVHREHRVIAALVERLYDEVAAGTGEALPSWKASTLLVSSPTAFVEYHADAVPNFLWHIRGRKRVWIYPAHEERYCPAAILEDICTGHKPEGLPYDESLDAGAVCVDLEPGQVVSWPLNAPHRVQNLEGLNVSLSTEHVTKATRKSLRVVR
nr:hypothetical protein [Planctomycetota bacterium]